MEHTFTGTEGRDSASDDAEVAGFSHHDAVVHKEISRRIETREALSDPQAALQYALSHPSEITPQQIKDLEAALQQLDTEGGYHAS